MKTNEQNSPAREPVRSHAWLGVMAPIIVVTHTKEGNRSRSSVEVKMPTSLIGTPSCESLWAKAREISAASWDRLASESQPSMPQQPGV
jgi:hypothetical protein